MAKTQLSVSTLKDQLKRNKDILTEYLPGNCDIDSYIGGIVEEFEKNHALYTCSPASVMQSVRKAALAGLPLGQDLCYLVPYANKCQFQIGYRGLLYLAREAGAILRHVVRSVHDGDRFTFDDGLSPSVAHARQNDDRTYETMTHVYAHFALPNRQEHLEVMTKHEVEDHKRRYTKAGGKDSPWQTNPLAMAKKTVIRRAFAGDQIHLSHQLRQVVVADEFNEVIDGQVVESHEPSPDEQEEIRQQELAEQGLFEKHEQKS